MMEKNYEKSLARLEEIASALEKGGQSLDESLALFEEGVGLYASCSKQLEQARQRIEKITKNAGVEVWEEQEDDF